jgi:hypothetical protein
MVGVINRGEDRLASLVASLADRVGFGFVGHVVLQKVEPPPKGRQG